MACRPRRVMLLAATSVTTMGALVPTSACGVTDDSGCVDCGEFPDHRRPTDATRESSADAPVDGVLPFPDGAGDDASTDSTVDAPHDSEASATDVVVGDATDGPISDGPFDSE